MQQTIRYMCTLFMLMAESACGAHMKLIECMPEKFYDSALTTEWAIYKQLKERPIKADVAYYAIPFRWYAFHAKLKEIPFEESAKGGFSIFQPDDCYMSPMMLVANDLGLSVIFACAGQGQTYKGMKILPCPYAIEHKIEPSNNKDIWYSFIGSKTHSFRKRVFEIKTERADVVIKRRTSFHYNITSQQEREKLREEYVDILARSRFSLCPRGGAPNTIRFWESLGAGAIPVVVPAEDLYLPDIFDWSSCIVAIPDAQLERIEEILSKITPQQEARMREAGYRAFELFSGDNLTLCIRKYYEEGPWDVWNPLGRAAPPAHVYPNALPKPPAHPAVQVAIPKPKPMAVHAVVHHETPIESMKKEVARLLAKASLTGQEKMKLMLLQKQLVGLLGKHDTGLTQNAMKT